MAKSNTVTLVTEIAKPIAEQFGLMLWDVAFEKEGASWFLRVFLDRPDGIMEVSDCENVSRLLSDKLDELDPIDQSYYLEVSSAGLGRKLKKQQHFDAFLGQQVTIKLIRPIEKQREFTGILESFENQIVTIQTDKGEFSVPFSDCSYVKLDDDLDLF
ncbi:ribosome maturation factor RimP [Clostridium facile]|uniref:Ribosome maturation factor RimP n=1 Tax=Clostridium facile TaxID=2763035 RepID=A0ABR7IRV0_9CLOT|nr:ribosome maturation factor RimP [Clostridium facile]MBC5787876.1 ribosome maturation factor RimP [Clostridium facile]